jgi:hypothetical protein
MCSTGGARNKTWRRMSSTVSSLSAKDGGRVKIGQKWGTEQRDGTVRSSLNFSVSRGPVTVSGDVPVVAGGTWGGSSGPDPRTGKVGNSTNQVNSSWDFAYPGVGTAKFKGNVGHGLYEWAQADRRAHAFAISASFRRRY